MAARKKQLKLEFESRNLEVMVRIPHAYKGTFLKQVEVSGMSRSSYLASIAMHPRHAVHPGVEELQRLLTQMEGYLREIILNARHEAFNIELVLDLAHQSLTALGKGRKAARPSLLGGWPPLANQFLQGPSLVV